MNELTQPTAELPLYLDYAATTPLAAEVAGAMQICMRQAGAYANPSSVHVEGLRSAAAVQQARTQLAELLGTAPRNLIWTSGATESNNLALRGGATFRANRGRHVISMPVEHKAVTDVLKQLVKDGFEVSWIEPEPDGLLDLGKLAAALREDTQLVSIMHVNNETGVIQDIESIGKLCREHDVLFHTDAAQSVGKLTLNLDSMPIDLLSLTAHKFYGPQGIGALYIADRPGCQVHPLMFGGGHERRLRPGTLPVHQIVGCGAAAELGELRMQESLRHVAALRDRLWHRLSELPGIHRNGSEQHCYPGILNVSAESVDGESLMLALSPVCVATGSACNSITREPSYVLRALGRSDHLAQSAIRFSFGFNTTQDDIDRAADKYVVAVKRLRAMAPAAEH